MQALEKEMIELITADLFAVAEREAAHQWHTNELIRKMAVEDFPFRRARMNYKRKHEGELCRECFYPIISTTSWEDRTAQQKGFCCFGCLELYFKQKVA